MNPVLRLLFVILITTWFVPFWFAEAAVRVTPNSEEVLLSGHLYLLTDTGGTLELADVLNAFHANRFHPVPGFLNRGYIRETSWLQFSCKRDSDGPETVYLWIDQPFLDEIDLFFQTGKDPLDPGAYTVHSLGDHTCRRTMPYVHPRPVAPLTLLNGEEHLIFIRIRGRSTQNFSGALLSGNQVRNKTVKWAFYQGGYLFTAVVLSIINLMLAFRLKNKVYAWHGIYLSTLFLLHASLQGCHFIIWPGTAHYFSDQMTAAGNGLGFAAFSMFSIVLFNTTKNYPASHIYLVTVILFGMLTFFGAQTQWYGLLASTLHLMGLGLVGLVLALAILERKKTPETSMFLIAFSSAAAGAWTVFLRVLDILPVNWLTMNAHQICSLLYMLLMTLAISERLLNAEQKASKAAKEAESRAVKLAEEMTVELSDQKVRIEKALDREKNMRDNQSQFIDMISHEYRTPLAILQTNVDLIEVRRKKHKPVREKHVKKLKLAVRRLAEIFSKALDKSFSSNGDAPLYRKEIFSLAGYLAHLESILTDLWGKGRFRFTTTLEPDTNLFADKELLTTALTNIAENAVKYSIPGAPIAVDTSVFDKTIRIDVINRVRPGAKPPEHTWFSRHTRGDGGLGTDGTGMGLYLVRSIVREHDGRVLLEKRGRDKIQVSMFLPASKNQ